MSHFLYILFHFLIFFLFSSVRRCDHSHRRHCLVAVLSAVAAICRSPLSPSRPLRRCRAPLSRRHCAAAATVVAQLLLPWKPPPPLTLRPSPRAAVSAIAIDAPCRLVRRGCCLRYVGAATVAPPPLLLLPRTTVARLMLLWTPCARSCRQCCYRCAAVAAVAARLSCAAVALPLMPLRRAADPAAACICRICYRLKRTPAIVIALPPPPPLLAAAASATGYGRC